MSYEIELTLVVLASLAIGILAFAGARRIGGGASVKRMLRIAGVVLALLAAYVFQPLPEMPAWEEPATEQERKARDFAHSIVLPDSVPKPVPFNFAIARLKALVPGLPDVSEQYFKHLCDTEAGQYIFKTAENVDGFLQMRPRRRFTDNEQMNPFLLESAVGLSRSAGEFYSTSISGVRNGGPMYFVQPMVGNYLWIDQPEMESSGVIHYQRKSGGLAANIVFDHVSTLNGQFVRVPFILEIMKISSSSARFAYTYRGLRRAHDRQHWIAGSELIVLDLDSKELLGIYREFKKASGANARWDNSISCSRIDGDFDFAFVSKILRPNPNANKTIPYHL